MSARIIALCNQKGGVGKTTSSINIAAALTRAGRKVLAVDLDPQGSLTVGVGLEERAAEQTVTTAEILLEGANAADAVLANICSGFDVIPADIRLSAADLKLVSLPGRETILRDALEEIAGNYDYILLDCPPNLSVVTLNGLAAAQELIIPQQSNFLALSGASLLLDTVALVRKRINRKLNISGVVLTMHNSRTNHAKEIESQARDFFGSRVYTTVIRNNVALADAPARGLDIFQYDARSNGAADYKALAAEIMKQEEPKQ